MTPLLVGDALTVLKTLPDGIAQCCVTSPPYWGLRTYGVENQLGLERTPEEYVSKLVEVFREVRRVLRDDGTVWLNMGDSYVASPPGNKPGWTTSGLHGASTSKKYQDTLSQSVQMVADKQLSHLKPKDPVGVPWRLAFALQADGWWLRRDVIWNKPNPMPESCTDRPTSSHEYIFLLTKSGTSQYWTHRDKDGVRRKPRADWRWVNQITQEEVAEAPPDWKERVVCPQCNGTGTGVLNELMGAYVDDWGQVVCSVCDGKKEVQRWKRVNLWRGHDYFYDQEAVREKAAVGYRDIDFVPKSVKDQSCQGIQTAATGASKNNRTNQFRAHRNLRSVWTFPTEPYPEAHFATFPRELARRCILAGTSAKGACPECGAPWERVIESTKRFESGSGKSGNPISGKHPAGCQGGGDTGDIRKGPVLSTYTLGFRPTCSCGYTDTVPCLVLDPFIGSGTTAEVAIDLDRDIIGIDLNPDYIEKYAKKRVEQAQKRQAARKQQEVLSL